MLTDDRPSAVLGFVFPAAAPEGARGPGVRGNWSNKVPGARDTMGGPISRSGTGGRPMVHAALLCVGLLASPGPDPTLPPAATAGEALKAYEAEKAKAGRDTAAQVKLALWCEAHGLQAERVKHLALAVLT